MLVPTQIASPPSTAAQLLFVPRWQSRLVVAIVASVLCLDQVSKAWGWRHIDDAFIDPGGGTAVTPSVGMWFENRTTGAALDVADAIMLTGLFMLLGRRRRSIGVLLSASLVLAGCVSDLADRLGLHHWTAPGSVRGVVDFVPLADRSWNIADFAIVVGTLGLMVSLSARWLRPAQSPATAVPHLFAYRRTHRILAGAFLLTAMLAAIGAYWYGGILVPMG